jgi:hypothetical protein
MLSVVLNLWVVVGGELSVDLDCDKALRQDYSHFAHLEFHISILLFHSFNIGGTRQRILLWYTLALFYVRCSDLLYYSNS